MVYLIMIRAEKRFFKNPLFKPFSSINLVNFWRLTHGENVTLQKLKKYVFYNFSVFLWIHQGETWVAVGEAKEKC